MDSSVQFVSIPLTFVALRTSPAHPPLLPALQVEFKSNHNYCCNRYNCNCYSLDFGCNYKGLVSCNCSCNCYILHHNYMCFDMIVQPEHYKWVMRLVLRQLHPSKSLGPLLLELLEGQIQEPR